MVTVFQQQTPPLDWPYYGIGFAGAVRRGFVKYATFRGRAGNAQFWWWQLFVLLGMIAATVLFYAAAWVGGTDGVLVVVASVVCGGFYLAVLLPSLALMVRRLHDAGHSGWAYFITFIPLVGSFIVFVFLLSGTSPRAAWFGPPGPADWGVAPSGAGVAPGAAATPYGPGVSLGGIEPPRRSSRAPVIVAAAVVAVIVLIVGGGLIVRQVVTDKLTSYGAGSGTDVPETGTGMGGSESTDMGGGTETESSEPSQDPLPPMVVGQKPKKAKACPSIYSLGSTPSRSAVNAKTTTCEFAEEVRRAYISSGQQGLPEVELADVYSPRTQKYYSLSCRGVDTVKCTGGIKAEVYLY